MSRLIQGRLTWKGFVASVADTLRISCMVIVIVAGAVIFGRFLAVTRIPFDIAAWVVELPVFGTVILMIIFTIYIIGGAVMDALALLLITIPIFLPIIKALHIDPIWFGVVMLLNMEMALTSPPFGLSLFVMKGVSPKGVSMRDIYLAAIPFLLCDLVAMVLIIAFPSLVLWLPGKM